MQFFLLLMKIPKKSPEVMRQSSLSGDQIGIGAAAGGFDEKFLVENQRGGGYVLFCYYYQLSFQNRVCPPWF